MNDQTRKCRHCFDPIEPLAGAWVGPDGFFYCGKNRPHTPMDEGPIGVDDHSIFTFFERVATDEHAS